MASGISVAIVNWNSGPLLERCIKTIIAQTLPADRILVVDNGSEDGSAAAANVAGVEVAWLGRNAGFAAASNRAIETLADTPWIAMLNPDAFAEPDWLRCLAQATRQNPEYAAFASRQLRAGDPSRLDGTGDVYAPSGLAWRRDHGAVAQGRRLHADEVFGPCAAAALYDRQALERVSGFDESFFCYFEDVDLAFRLRLAGYRSLYVPDAVVHHVGSAISGRGSDFSVYHGHRNLVWTWLKNMPGPLLATYWPLHLVQNAISVLHFSARGQARAILAAKRDALRGLPRVWGQRKKVQAGRVASVRDLGRSMAGGLAGLRRTGHSRPTWRQ